MRTLRGYLDVYGRPVALLGNSICFIMGGFMGNAGLTGGMSGSVARTRSAGTLLCQGRRQRGSTVTVRAREGFEGTDALRPADAGGAGQRRQVQLGVGERLTAGRGVDVVVHQEDGEVSGCDRGPHRDQRGGGPGASSGRRRPPPPPPACAAGERLTAGRGVDVVVHQEDGEVSGCDGPHRGHQAATATTRFLGWDTPGPAAAPAPWRLPGRSSPGGRRRWTRRRRRCPGR